MLEMNHIDTAAGPAYETLEALLEINYCWGYTETREQLRALYTKAARDQWVPDEVLPWHRAVELDRPIYPEEYVPLHGTDVYARLTERERRRLCAETHAWSASQFLHGEQGALLAAAQLVDAVPDLDSKLYAATQVVDEARHVDVYNRYLHDKLGIAYPVSPHLKVLLNTILKDSRWDMKLLGMQIMVEGLALAAFSNTRQTCQEPLFCAIVTYVMQDEARHVAYGLLSLRDYYRTLSEREVHEREDFVYEAAALMRDRFLYQEVWEAMGLPVAECVQLTFQSPSQRLFRELLFSRIVPAVKKLGLLSERQRQRFDGLGILKYEHWEEPAARA